MRAPHDPHDTLEELASCACAKCQLHALANQIKLNIPPDGRQGGAVGVLAAIIKYAVYNCKASRHTSLAGRSMPP